jgi:hypothetical protein
VIVSLSRMMSLTAVNAIQPFTALMILNRTLSIATQFCMTQANPTTIQSENKAVNSAFFIFGVDIVIVRCDYLPIETNNGARRDEST